MASVDRTRDAGGMKFKAPRVETRKASRGEEWGGGINPSSRLEGLWERRKLPQSPGEKIFYCFLSLPERLSLQRVLKINVVYSRPLVAKKGFSQWVRSNPLSQPRKLPR